MVRVTDRSSRPDVFCEKVLLEISQNSQENTCEFCKISKNTFFYRTPLVAASAKSQMLMKISQYNVYFV